MPQILLPKVESFPLFTRIPFKIRVITITKEMKYEQKDGNEGEKVFPVPPLHPREIEMVLRCHVYITATGWSSTDSATVAPIGGMGRAAPQNGVGSDVVHTYEKKWVPHNTDKQTGSWRQETEMQSRFELKWSPSFSTRNLTQRVSLSTFLNRL